MDSGGASISWSIMREDRIHNQLVHLIDDSIDSGPIIDNDLSLFPRQCQILADYQSYKLNKFLKFYSNFIKNVKGGINFDLKIK